MNRDIRKRIFPFTIAEKKKRRCVKTQKMKHGDTKTLRIFIEYE